MKYLHSLDYFFIADKRSRNVVPVERHCFVFYYFNVLSFCWQNPSCILFYSSMHIPIIWVRLICFQFYGHYSIYVNTYSTVRSSHFGLYFKVIAAT